MWKNNRLKSWIFWGGILFLPCIFLRGWEQFEKYALVRSPSVHFETREKEAYFAFLEAYQKIEKRLNRHVAQLQKTGPLEKNLRQKESQLALFSWLQSYSLDRKESIQIIDESGHPIAWQGWGITLPPERFQENTASSFLHKELTRTEFVLLVPIQTPFQKLWICASSLLEIDYPIQASFLPIFSFFREWEKKVQLPCKFYWPAQKGYPIFNQFEKTLLSLEIIKPQTPEAWEHFRQQELTRISQFFLPFYVVWGCSLIGVLLGICFFQLRRQWSYSLEITWIGFLWLGRILFTFFPSTHPLFQADYYSDPDLFYPFYFFPLPSLTASLGDLTLTLLTLLATWFGLCRLQKKLFPQKINSKAVHLSLAVGLSILGSAIYLFFEKFVRSLAQKTELYFFDPLVFIPDWPVFLAKTNLGIGTFLLFWMSLEFFSWSWLLLGKTQFPKKSLGRTFCFFLLSALFWKFIGVSFPDYFWIIFIVFLTTITLLSVLSNRKWRRRSGIVLVFCLLCFSYQRLQFYLDEHLQQEIEERAQNLKEPFTQRLQNILETSMEALPQVLPELSWDALPLETILTPLKQLKAEYQLRLYSPSEVLLGPPLLLSQFPNDWFPNPVLLEKPSKTVEHKEDSKRDIQFLVISKRFVDFKNRPMGWLYVAVPTFSSEQFFETSFLPSLNIQKYNSFEDYLKTYPNASTQDEAFWEQIQEQPKWRVDSLSKALYQNYYFKADTHSKIPTIYSVGIPARTYETQLVRHLRLGSVYAFLFLVWVGIRFCLRPYRISQIKFTFTHRVLASFLILSAIPLIFLSNYQKNSASRGRRSSFEEHLNRMTRIALKTLQGRIQNAALLETKNPHQALTLKSFLNSEFCREFNSMTGYGLNLFYQGHLIASNRPEYFEMQFFPSRMNPVAYTQLILKQNESFITEEFLGTASYTVGYRLISEGDFVGALSVPLISGNDDFARSQIALYWRLVYIYLGLLLILTLLSTFLTKHLTQPIQLLLQGTRKLSEGDFNYRIPHQLKGEFGELIGSFNQMTRALKESQEKLVIAEKNAAWREMAKQIAHEIKNPLTPMKLSAQHIYYAYQDKAEDFNSILEKGISAIIRQIDALGKIATEFSNFAKFPTRRFEAIDPLQIVHECEQLYRQTENVQITLQIAPSLPKIIADADELKRVFINLIRNAIQAMPKGGEIRIGAKEIVREGLDYVEFRIKDTGPGIPPEYLSRLFEPNFSTKTDGTGLGLAICKKAIEAYRGGIEVNSPPKEGAEFIFWLPARPSKPIA